MADVTLLAMVLPLICGGLQTPRGENFRKVQSRLLNEESTVHLKIDAKPLIYSWAVRHDSEKCADAFPLISALIFRIMTIPLIPNHHAFRLQVNVIGIWDISQL